MDHWRGCKTLNRVNFNGELWTREELLINADTKLLDEIIRKFPNMDRVIETFNLLINIRNTRTTNEIASLLWRTYFNSLWSKYPVDSATDVEGDNRFKNTVLGLSRRPSTRNKSRTSCSLMLLGRFTI